uniref:Putative energy transducer TonB n=1 Tax=uncultured organism TaxID=155900 RepID=A0A8A1V5P1_9ZZZZ|nr:putative energy transducer TonB [uncultured organism]
MKKIILIAVLFFSLISFGQTPMDRIVFFDSIRKETFSKEYHSKQIIKEYNLDKTSYEVEFFNRVDNVDILKIRFFVNDKIKLTRHGAVTSFYNSGAIMEVENFDNGVSIDGKSWYENGNKKLEMRYFFDVIEKTFDKSIDNYWDSENNQKVKDGNGDYEYNLGMEDERIVISGKVVDGKYSGKWSTQADFYPYFEEYYSKGKLLNGVRKSSKTEAVYYTKLQTIPEPVGGMNEFRREIGAKMKTNRQRTAVDGTILARFYVDTDGKIQNPVITRSLNEYFDNQLIKILNNSEKWTPGTYRGMKVKTYFTLPIKITITSDY